MESLKIQCVGYDIAADLYAGSDKNVLLVLHGWASNKTSQQALTQYLCKETGASTVVIEYSGHGHSPFDPMLIRPAQHFLEVITAFDFVRSRFPKATITVIGTSYGGYLAVQLTKYRVFHNLVLRVPAIYRPDEFYTLNKDIDRQHERNYREDKEFLDNHPLLKRAADFTGRTLVVVHENDEYIPKETTDKYIEVFKADSYLAKGWGHRYKIDAPIAEQTAYKEAIRNWILKSI